VTTAVSHREHGTYVKYVQDRCRCDLCRAANRDYKRQRAQRIAPPYVAAGPVRAHLRELGAAGVGLKQVARVSGVSHGTLSKLMYGDGPRGRAPSKRVRPETAEKLIAVTPSDIAAGAKVPAGPTHAHIERLVAAGVPKRRIAERLGQNGPGLQVGRQEVTAGTARMVAAMASEMDAGTLVTVRRSRHGDQVIAPAPALGDDSETRDEVARARAAHRRAAYRAAERDEPPPPIVYDDRDRVILSLVEVLEQRIDQADWRASAACRGRPAWIWFPARGDHETLAAARRVCGACLVRDQCLDANLDTRDGVYGGLSAKERRELRKNRLQVAS
jgi:hypothetical protein